MLLLHRRTAASGDEAVAGMLQEIGPPVLLGGLTTFLGISPLILSNSTVFRTFFKMFLGIIVFGLGHGLVLMPVVLSLLGARASGTAPAIEAVDARTSSKGDAADAGGNAAEEQQQLQGAKEH